MNGAAGSGGASASRGFATFGVYCLVAGLSCLIWFAIR
jgi:hypothetical protein